MNHLDDKSALITGGRRGIGRVIALQLAQRGARAAAAARSEGELVETTSAIAAAGGRAHATAASSDSDAIGRVLRDRFTERHAAGDLSTPEASAAAPARRLADDASGEIRDVADDRATPSPSTERTTLTRLNPGDTFPSLTITPADGHPLELPAALAGHFGVVLLYRGGWCPYCNAQLRAFRRAADQLDELDIRAVALSVDDEATTRQTIAEHGLDFPVGQSADADAIAAATGAFINDEPPYLQSTGFVLDREGRVIVSVYSSGAIGRLVPDEVIGLIEYVRGHEPQGDAA
jgi:peroxiredoxin